MKRLWVLAAGAFFSLSLASNCSAGGGAVDSEPIRYEISLEKPEQHLFHVLMRVPNVDGELTVQIPAWNALYQIRDFSNRIQQVEAHASSTKLPIEKTDKETWRVRGSGTIRIDYATYWDDVGPFGTQLNAEHAFINPAMILMYVPGRIEDKAQLSLTGLPTEWRATSALKLECAPVEGKPFCREEKTSYSAIVDSPIEVGKFKEFAVPGTNANIRVVVHGDNWGQKKIEDTLAKICNYELKLMEGAPFQQYTFFLHIGKNAGGGGMEHANSTAIGVPSDEYLAGVAAHEFFHLWNVKRIRPATLEPVDFTKEQYTRALWFAEGVTSTYASYTLVRSGIWSKERFYADFGDQITELGSRPANRWQSAEESSLDAWLEKYPVYNGADYSVSYYTKGQVVGDLLDILIRERTNNAKSLDDVFRAMNTDFAKQKRWYRDSLDVRLEAEKVAGGSFEEFFRDYVAAAGALPYTQILGLAGLELRVSEHKRATLGFTAGRESDGTIVVRAVDVDGPAAQAGLLEGDVLLGWNGGDVPRFLSRWVREHQPGETVKVRLRREEKELTLEFKLGEAKEVIYQVSEDAHANEKARRIREGLLHGMNQTAAQ